MYTAVSTWRAVVISLTESLCASLQCSLCSPDASDRGPCTSAGGDAGDGGDGDPAPSGRAAQAHTAGTSGLAFRLGKSAMEGRCFWPIQIGSRQCGGAFASLSSKVAGGEGWPRTTLYSAIRAGGGVCVDLENTMNPNDTYRARERKTRKGESEREGLDQQCAQATLELGLEGLLVRFRDPVVVEPEHL